MVTENSQKKYGSTTKKRARDLSMAVFGQPEVINALSQATTHVRDLQILNSASILQKELRRLQLQPGLGEFNAEADPRDLNIPGLINQTKDIAPGLWNLLKSLTETRSPGNPEPTKTPDGALFMICIVLAHFHSPRRSNPFHMLLGIHLHSMGAKRRLINLLAGLGITVNYRTILNYTDSIAHVAEVGPETLH
jgi:hypothetical protein